jgi:hypothetical protein
MFEKYMIVAEQARNTVENDTVTGFRFGARLPYYRGLGLSMVQDIGVTVDGEAVPREALRLTVHGNTYSLAEMEVEPEDRWEMGEVAEVHVSRPGGLAPGTHTLGLMVDLRISYLPFPAIRKAEKTISI